MVFSVRGSSIIGGVIYLLVLLFMIFVGVEAWKVGITRFYINRAAEASIYSMMKNGCYTFDAEVKLRQIIQNTLHDDTPVRIGTYPYGDQRSQYGEPVAIEIEYTITLFLPNGFPTFNDHATAIKTRLDGISMYTPAIGGEPCSEPGQGGWSISSYPLPPP